MRSPWWWNSAYSAYMKHDDGELNLRYAELLRKYKSNIAGFCIRRCGSGSEADDLMQEVFAALWQGMASLRLDCPPRVENRWVYSVMRTAWSRHCRLRSRIVTLPLDALPDPPAPRNDSAEVVEELLAALDADTSRLMRRHMAGYSNAELAAELGVRPGTIKKRITRAMQRMRRIYMKINGKQ